MSCFVLVGGWAGSGKTTLARALATEMHLPYLSKVDTLKPLDVRGAAARIRA